jgi:hypothetical protein
MYNLPDKLFLLLLVIFTSFRLLMSYYLSVTIFILCCLKKMSTDKLFSIHFLFNDDTFVVKLQ